MTSTHWIFAAIALGSGLLLGEIAGRILRGTMLRADRSPEVKEMARPVGTAVFWSGTALGLLLAVGSSSPRTFNRIPDRISVYLPNLLVAGLLLIGGYALAIAVSAAVGQSAMRGTGVRHRGLERMLRLAIMTAGAVLALSQLGVNTQVLVIVLGALLGAPALAIALLTGLGGRDVAANLAAGRALRGQLQVDKYLVRQSPDGSSIRGVIVAIHPVTVELLTDELATVHVPLQRLLEGTFEVHPHRSWVPEST